jgi:hypothetical protein
VESGRTEPLSFEACERFGLELAAAVAILENVGDADCRGNLLDPALRAEVPKSGVPLLAICPDSGASARAQ